MWLMISGVVLLAAVLGVFYLKDRYRKPWLARTAYSEGTMRLTVIAVALIVFGGLIALGDFFGFGSGPPAPVP